MRNLKDDICLCQGVTYETILNAIKNGAKTVEKLHEATDAGISCGYCIEALEEILEEELNK